jgi:hypothetical protein
VHNTLIMQQYGRIRHPSPCRVVDVEIKLPNRKTNKSSMLAPPPAPGTPSGDFLNNVMPQVSPAMLNYGVETTSNLLKSQRDLYMPGVSHFWNSLKIYFMVFSFHIFPSLLPSFFILFISGQVNNNYVLSKLKLLFFPFQNKVWQRVSVDESFAQQVVGYLSFPLSPHTRTY